MWHSHACLQKLKGRVLGNCARSMRLPDAGPVLDKNHAPRGPESLSSTGTGVWRRLLWHFQNSVLHWIDFRSALDRFQSAIFAGMVGELRAIDPNKCPRGHEANAGAGAQSEAPKRSGSRDHSSTATKKLRQSAETESISGVFP